MLAILLALSADAPALSLQRSAGGFVDPAMPFLHYSFTLAKDGAWELKGAKTLKGKLKDGEAAKWVKEVEDAGFAKLKSNPALGAADEAFLEINLGGGKKAGKRIRLEEKLAEALDKKVMALAKSAK